MQFIIASHGRYAIEARNSCQMITGLTEKIHPIAFTESMGLEDVVCQYEELIKKYTDDSITIIVDILGGTPCNAAIIVANKYENITIVAGLSLAILIPLSLGESLEETILSMKENTKIVTTEKSLLQNEDGEEED
ncbi:PTS sugar transporter subunit IIA [Cytobacillus sp. Hz8]|uniref:PTS sugar transporter subunit IIA n=1 Tax=Cytobacillus sp. Hz8 TaxID=3347168 RepID=UPI0035E2E733